MVTDSKYAFPDTTVDMPLVTRFEIIDHREPTTRRTVVVWDQRVQVTCSIQDQGRTLKVFLKERKEEDDQGVL